MAYGFFANESGAITTDWVVLAAAVVGLGVGTVASVRTGTTALGADIDASLSGSSVSLLGDACKSAPSASDYKPAILSDKDQTYQREHLAKLDDSGVQKTFSEVSVKTDWYMQNDPESKNVQELVDYAALIGSELEGRGLDYPKETGDFGAYYERVNGPVNTTLCSTPTAGTEGGTNGARAMLMLDTYENGEVKLKYQKSLAGYEAESLLEFSEKSAVLAKQAIGEGDQKTAAYQLDLLALAVDEAASREKMLPDADQYSDVHEQLTGYYNDAFPTR
jgi:hypothetical protein